MMAPLIEMTRSPQGLGASLQKPAKRPRQPNNTLSNQWLGLPPAHRPIVPFDHPHDVQFSPAKAGAM